MDRETGKAERQTETTLQSKVCLLWLRHERFRKDKMDIKTGRQRDGIDH